MLMWLSKQPTILLLNSIAFLQTGSQTCAENSGNDFTIPDTGINLAGLSDAKSPLTLIHQ